MNKHTYIWVHSFIQHVHYYQAEVPHAACLRYSRRHSLVSWSSLGLCQTDRTEMIHTKLKVFVTFFSKSPRIPPDIYCYKLGAWQSSQTIGLPFEFPSQEDKVWQYFETKISTVLGISNKSFLPHSTSFCQMIDVEDQDVSSKKTIYHEEDAQ